MTRHERTRAQAFRMSTGATLTVADEDGQTLTRPSKVINCSLDFVIN